MKVNSFSPIADLRSKILILGSMPGVQSLNMQQYYAHPYNHFWPIVYGIFDLIPDSEYSQKVLFLKDKGIALWDVLASCNRLGSLDSNIKNEEANDLRGFFDSHPGIHDVFFNGIKAYETFRKKIGIQEFADITFYRLPSTSPANTKQYSQKLEEWMAIARVLEQNNELP